MKKIFSIITVTLVLVAKVFGQAQVDIPLDVTDGSFTIQMAVGLDTTATDCIDPQLGEADLPPYPPPGLFEARFDLTSYGCGPLSTYKDYRAPGDPPAFPFTGSKEHNLIWQLSSSTSDLTIFYNFPAGVWANLKDPFGGILFDISIIDSGSINLPIPQLGEAILTMHYNNIGGDPTPNPVFAMYPDSLNFGEVPFGQTETLPIMITNVGYLDSLIITNIISHDSSFTFEPNTFPITIAPIQTDTFYINYTGLFIGDHIDSILFANNAAGSPHKLMVYATTSEPYPNCQAQVLEKVIISDGTAARWLRFGLDSSATDGIDPQLGEFGPLPPFPPAGAFEAQLFLPENNFSGTLSAYCDFRYAEIPFTGQKEWRLAYQPGYGTEIIISWDFPEYMTGTLLDIINGSFINVPMVASGNYTVENPYSFNRLKMLIDYNITTPVELVSFSATLLNNNVQLSWTTATETNNSGFEIERASLSATPGQGWEKIGFLLGFGTTTEPKVYSFNDEEVSTGIYKYRLKQIDFDGSYEYSNEIELEVDFTPKEFVLYQNYPNPFNPSTVISYQLPVTSKVSLKIYDVLGNEVAILVNDERQPGVYKVEFDASSFASGMYLYKLQAGIFIQTKKMVLLK